MPIGSAKFLFPYDHNFLCMVFNSFSCSSGCIGQPIFVLYQVMLFENEVMVERNPLIVASAGWWNPTVALHMHHALMLFLQLHIKMPSVLTSEQEILITVAIYLFIFCGFFVLNCRLGMCMVCSTSCKHLLRSPWSFRSWSRRRKDLNSSPLPMDMITMVEVMSWKCWDISAWWACFEFIVFWVIIIRVWSAYSPLTLVNKVFTPVLLEATLQPFIILGLPILCCGGMLVLYHV